MKLSSPELVRSLIARSTAVNEERPRRDHSARSPVLQRQRNCQCGHCRQCVENARWDRIFAEKFADPDYYAARLPRQGSSLSWQ